MRECGRRVDRSGRIRKLIDVMRSNPVAATVIGVTLGWLLMRLVRR